jgi:hypothetical protein
MIDANGTILAWIAGDTATMALATGGVFSPKIPQDYNPTNGLALAVSSRGGTAEDECPILEASIQVLAWAPQDEGLRARALYRAIFDLMHGKTNINLGAAGYIFSAVEEVAGQDGEDPETKWATVTSFFKVMMRSN